MSDTLDRRRALQRLAITLGWTPDGWGAPRWRPDAERWP